VLAAPSTDGLDTASSLLIGNLYSACTGSGCLIASKSPSNNAFDFLIGGGIDIPVNEHIAEHVDSYGISVRVGMEATGYSRWLFTSLFH
jgi:hypothetical protein